MWLRAFLLVGDYAGEMRYPDGGGLTPAARAKREQVRIQAGELFAVGVAPAQVAKTTESFAQVRLCLVSGLAGRRAGGMAVDGAEQVVLPAG